MMMYRGYLKNSGFQMIPASYDSGGAGGPGEHPAAIIILDVVLRSEDAWRFLAELKEDARTRDIPVTDRQHDRGSGQSFSSGRRPSIC